MLIRIRHTCVALLHKKTVLPLETRSEINFEFIKFVKKGKCLPLTKTNREYYINITFPDWVIVETIILRNVIITFPEMTLFPLKPPASHVYKAYRSDPFKTSAFKKKSNTCSIYDIT